MAYLNRDEEYFDISEKILELSDELAEEIILTNIGDQLSSKLDLFTEKINYLTLFRRKYTEITSQNTFYDKVYVKETLTRVTDLVKDSILKRYGISLGTDLDFYFPDNYLKDMETLYEFFFIRHFENLVTYFNTELIKNHSNIVKRYEKLIQEDTHNKDIFVIQAKKKFKNIEDVIVLHFLNEIIDDIRDSMNSAYVLFDSIIATDPYEEFNVRASELLMNYGNGFIFEGDTKCYQMYMAPLKDQEVRNELRNAILMKYLETTEIEENM